MSFLKSVAYMSRHHRQARIDIVVMMGLFLLLLCLCTCSGNQSTLIDLVPSDSCALVVIDWSTVRADRDLKRAFNGDQLELVLQQLGLDSSAVKSIAIFSAMNSHAKAGMLVRGPLNRRSEISALKTSGWHEEADNGHQLFVKGRDYVALPQGNTFFAGTREGALAVFQTLNDRRLSFSSSTSYKKILAGMTTQNNPIRAFLVIPQGTLDMADAALEATSFALSLFDLGGIGLLLKQINVASGFGLGLGLGTDHVYPVEMCVLMRDEKAAAFISGSLNLLKSFSGAAATNARDEQAIQTLRDLSITRRGEVLSLKLKVPQTALSPPSGR
jgi:hypothetical protein